MIPMSLSDVNHMSRQEAERATTRIKHSNIGGRLPKSKLKSDKKYLVQFAKDHHEKEDEGISKVTDTVVANPVAGVTVIQPTTSGVTNPSTSPTTSLGSAFISAGIVSAQDASGLPPGIRYVTEAQRESHPLSLNEVNALSRKKLEIMLNKPKVISENEAAVSAAMGASGTRSDEWVKHFSVVILPGERKYQRNSGCIRFVGLWTKRWVKS
jgi:hypothetical protein